MVDGMEKRRKKIIITACILAVVLALCAVLACGGSTEGETARKDGQEKTLEKTAEETTEKDTEDTGKGKETAPTKQGKEGCTVMSRTAVHEDPVGTVCTVVRNNEEPEETVCTAVHFYEEPEGSSCTAVPDHEVYQETESTPARDAAEHPETQLRSEPEPTAHVHYYDLADTRTVEHPAVTEQVWVVDSQAWDEVVRDGYHVCVVTCHECGAQFKDTSQANALEAWGDHTDEAHDGDGGYDMAASYDVPPETVHHDASGHYETRTITAGWTEYIDTYRCHCGDSYTVTR